MSITASAASAASEEIDYDVYYGDLGTFVMDNFPPVSIVDIKSISSLAALAALPVVDMVNSLEHGLCCLGT